MFKTIYNSVGDAFGLFWGYRVWSTIANAMNYLKKLWSGYQDRQRYRKEVKQRLLRQRSWKREQSPFSGHWTDRFLKLSAGIIVFPAMPSGGGWKVWFPLLCLLGLLAYMPAVASQIHEKGDSVALSVGDQVPDLALHHLLNYSNQEAHLSDFKGKLVILDFWATWCAPCLSMIPKMDSLQDRFPSLNFISVAYQSEQTVRSFFARWQQEKGRSVKVPCVTGDAYLAQRFPHQSLPHYVWIKAGKVYAITGYEEVNAKNIALALEDKQSQLQNKIDPKQAVYDASLPLFKDGNGGDPPLIYRNIWSGYAPGIGGGFSMLHPDGDHWVITARNQTLPALYQLAFSDGKGKIPFKRVRLLVKDTAAVYSWAHGVDFVNWMSAGHHVYCYELNIPDRFGNAFAWMRQQLQHFFPNYQASMDTLRVPALVLKRTTQEDKLKTKGGTPALKFDQFGGMIQNSYLNHLVIRLENYYLSKDSRPVLNETGYTGRIDLVLHGNLGDVAHLNQQLAAYGLTLAEEIRPIPYLVIRDSEKGVMP